MLLSPSTLLLSESRFHFSTKEGIQDVQGTDIDASSLNVQVQFVNIEALIYVLA